jgi:uncharacterized protein (DUF2236 family)
MTTRPTDPASAAELAGFDMRDHLPGVVGMAAAGANVIMQLGVPGVGHGVAESAVDSGNVLLHPWKRLRTTTSYLTVALFGTEADRAAFREGVNQSHRPVRSGPDSPVSYNAFDPDLQLWVAACLYVGFRDARSVFLGALDEPEAERMLQYCSRLATSLQVPPDRWPADLEAFDRYWNDRIAGIRYDDLVRDHLMAVIDLRMLPGWLRIGNAQLNRFLTTGMLPPDFRSAMRLDWSSSRQRRFDRLVAIARFGTRLTPRWLRFLPVRLQLMEVRLRIRRGWRLV